MVRRSIFFSTALMAGLLMIMPRAIARPKVDADASEPKAADRDGIRLRVLVCDQAAVATKILEEGHRVASLIFREAGIGLEWLDGREHSVTEARCVLQIHCCFGKLKSKLHDRTMAFAPAGGRHVTIFWDRIRVEAAAGSHSEGMLLGYVIAHELGHLLLPPGYHSAYGVMQGRLHYEDLNQARRLGNLSFSEKEVARMQAALRAGLADTPPSQRSATP